MKCCFSVEVAVVKGRLLKVDDPTFNKKRLDYARLLISTKILNEIKLVEIFELTGENISFILLRTLNSE
jgi:hypothetical protein